MTFFKVAKDGGQDSHVTGYFLVEIKSLFTIVLLHFEKGTRDAFHSHAFNALTLWLKGTVKEHTMDEGTHLWAVGQLKFTPRNCFHKVEAITDTWALSLRGPWVDMWKEYSRSFGFRTLTHGRKVVG